MVSRLSSFVWPVALAATLAGFSGCAGSKSGSSSKSSGPSAEELKNQKVEDARHSAEDAELKAHQLREEKNRNPAKTSSN